MTNAVLIVVVVVVVVLQFDNMDLEGSDLECESSENCPSFHVRSPEHAQAICDVYRSRCKGFVYILKSGQFHPKSEVSGKMTFQSGLTMYIKKEYASQAGKPSGSKCAIPTAVMKWSNECRVPDLNPFDENIMKLIHPHGPVHCPGQRFTEYRNGFLKLVDKSDEGWCKLLQLLAVN